LGIFSYPGGGGETFSRGMVEKRALRMSLHLSSTFVNASIAIFDCTPPKRARERVLYLTTSWSDWLNRHLRLHTPETVKSDGARHMGSTVRVVWGARCRWVIPLNKGKSKGEASSTCNATCPMPINRSLNSLFQVALHLPS